MNISSYPVEILVVAWGCVLAFVHIFSAIIVKTRQYGAEWNMSARDEGTPPMGKVAARLDRAQANYFETFPLVIAVALALVVVDRNNVVTASGASLWLVARTAYLPLYWMGVPKLRTFVFLASVAGMGMMLWPLLLP